MELEKYEDAIADYDAAIRMNPDDFNVYIQRALAKIGLDQCEEAIADCNTALHIDPNHFVAYNVRGRCESTIAEVRRRCC